MNKRRASHNIRAYRAAMTAAGEPGFSFYFWCNITLASRPALQAQMGLGPENMSIELPTSCWPGSF